MTAPARHRGPQPLRFSGAEALSPRQRLILVALKREARHPSLRFSYRGLAALLLTTSAVSLAVGFYLGNAY